MTVENYMAETAALAGLAGIMAGFSLAAVIQLLTGGRGGRLATGGVVVFSAASVMFLYPLIVAVLSLSAAAELARHPTELDNLNIGALLIMFGAIYVFIGIGWRLDTFRIAGSSTTFALITMCTVSYAIYVVLSIFPSTDRKDAFFAKASFLIVQREKDIYLILKHLHQLHGWFNHPPA
jgi:hypothetical protein